jgi:2-polyprenyl-6-methoxyphenol hydroxylase-like FAD-dependent oxidoreductase
MRAVVVGAGIGGLAAGIGLVESRVAVALRDAAARLVPPSLAARAVRRAIAWSPPR